MRPSCSRSVKYIDFNHLILLSTLGSILKDIKHKKPMTPAIIIIGNVVNYHSKIQKYLDASQSETVAAIGGMGFDIWKNDAVIA